ncbi:hypothetical protein GBAR_LOCUS29748 [Geodia barretti]|uniref:Uncharacterized protein n=1 Tax=Geodia barretti TaxID=519541 RepID=A0AA35TU55_GEOBA|nr:hypothetical protein GBAR_LOCUS29748 [Geodia barretti]
MVIVFFIRKLQRAKASTNTGVEMPTFQERNIWAQSSSRPPVMRPTM